MEDEVSQPTEPVQPAPQPQAQPQPQPKEEKRPEAPKGPGMFEKFKNRLLNYRRVLEISRKPDKDELTRTSRVVVLGIAIIGFMGFIISAIYLILNQLAAPVV
jgi:protein translocase SEC61 complex gamma subunit